MATSNKDPALPPPTLIDTVIKVADKKSLWSFLGVTAGDLPDYKRQAAQLIIDADLVRELIAMPAFECSLQFRPGTGRITPRFYEDGYGDIDIPLDSPHAADRLFHAYDFLEGKVKESREEQLSIRQPIRRAPTRNEVKRPKKQRPPPNYRERKDVLADSLDRADGSPMVHSDGELLHYGHMKRRWLENPEQYPEWGWRRDLLLSDKIMDKCTPSDWLRRICMFNGLSTTELAQLSGKSQSYWSALENESTEKNPALANAGLEDIVFLLEFSLTNPIKTGRYGKLAAGPLLGLPTIRWGKEEQEIVDPAIARKILNKFGFNDILYPKEKAALAVAAIETVAQQYLNNALPVQDVNSAGPATVKYLLREKKISSVFPRDSSEYDQVYAYMNGTGKDVAPAIAVLEKIHPTYGERIGKALRKLPHSEKMPVTGPLADDDALHFARQRARTIGEFLKFYRMGKALSPELVAEAYGGIARQNIVYYEKARSCSEAILAKHISANAYRFPVDANGQVRDDVADYMERINNARGVGFPENQPEGRHSGR